MKKPKKRSKKIVPKKTLTEALPAADAGAPQLRLVQGAGGEAPAEQRVRVRIDQQAMDTTYANAFRLTSSQGEVMVDFGLNTTGRSQEDENQREVLFQVSDRMIMNYYSVKRLAQALTQLVQRHEEQFGELELDVRKRAAGRK